MDKIGIIGAMESEVDELKKAMEVSEIVKKAGREFYVGSLNGADVVIVRSGIGKVNAALCVQILADLFQVTHLINTGIAGSLNADLDIGDILISRDAIHHDVDATVFGYPPGEVPGLKVREFQADKALALLAEKTCRKILPDLNVKTGRVLSGDQFISESQVKQRLIDLYHGDCAEMEGASIAHGAYLNQIPFVILRAISDKADHSAHMDYPEFERAAAKHSAQLLKAMLLEIGKTGQVGMAVQE
ncbi:MAG: 5'-methylthioadenosine/adenosylhomocysteine nucleosidase [Clostridium sp.]|jgi:adenosylhomocysteine nucleosidase|nr:5'-methylthioadenosine/adenosylhomocysteine nucleosidase [Clostridium sp.]